MTREEMARLLREVISNHDRSLHTAIEEFDWDLGSSDPFGESLRVLREIADELEKPNKDDGGEMTETTRKTNNILSLLTTEGGPNKLDIQLENLRACLEAAATIYLKIKRIETSSAKVTALAWEANGAMVSLVTEWERPRWTN